MSAKATTGDTRLTKVFVGGLAWETKKDGLQGYFERFGEILEAVVIFDRSTNRSKGYGFVTFREAEAARRACQNPLPTIDGREANCNLAYLGARSSKAQVPPYLQPYAGHIYGGSYMDKRAMRAAAIAAGGGAIFDYGIQQGIPAVYGYSPYLLDYSSFPPMAYGGLAGGAPYQVYNGNGSPAVTVAPGMELTMSDPTGLFNPYYPFTPVSPTAAHSIMQYPQMYQYAAVGALPESSPRAASSLHQFVGAPEFEPKTRGQVAGKAMSVTSQAPPASTEQYKLVPSKPAAEVRHRPVAAEDQKKPLA